VSLVIALLCILFFGAVLLLVVLNHGVSDINLLFRTYEQVPIAVVMVVSLLAGIVFTSFISIMDGVRIRVQNRRLRKRVVRLEDELEGMRHPREAPEAAPDEDSRPPVDYSSL
jgi:uncharacterized integral membrane protein